MKINLKFILMLIPILNPDWNSKDENSNLVCGLMFRWWLKMIRTGLIVRSNISLIVAFHSIIPIVGALSKYIIVKKYIHTFFLAISSHSSKAS